MSIDLSKFIKETKENIELGLRIKSEIDSNVGLAYVNYRIWSDLLSILDGGGYLNEIELSVLGTENPKLGKIRIVDNMSANYSEPELGSLLMSAIDNKLGILSLLLQKLAHRKVYISDKYGISRDNKPGSPHYDIDGKRRTILLLLQGYGTKTTEQLNQYDELKKFYAAIKGINKEASKLGIVDLIETVHGGYSLNTRDYDIEFISED